MYNFNVILVGRVVLNLGTELIVLNLCNIINKWFDGLEIGTAFTFFLLFFRVSVISHSLFYPPIQ